MYVYIYLVTCTYNEERDYIIMKFPLTKFNFHAVITGFCMTGFLAGKSPIQCATEASLNQRTE